jgi:hypothetical protein
MTDHPRYRIEHQANGTVEVLDVTDDRAMTALATYAIELLIDIEIRSEYPDPASDQFVLWFYRSHPRKVAPARPPPAFPSPQASPVKVLLPDYQKPTPDHPLYRPILECKPIPVHPTNISPSAIVPSHILSSELAATRRSTARRPCGSCVRATPDRS